MNDPLLSYHSAHDFSYNSIKNSEADSMKGDNKYERNDETDGNGRPAQEQDH